MTQENVTLVLNKYKKLVPKESVDILKSQLTTASDDNVDTLMSLRMRSRIIVMLMSFFLGGLGIDRFYLGHISLGIIKLAFRVLTVVFMLVTDFAVEAVVLGIISTLWCLADVYYTCRAVQEYNLDTITRSLK